MIINLPPQKTVTLADIVLDVAERNADEQTRQRLNQVRFVMQLPDCAVLFNTVIANACGGRIPIAENTLHKAVDCVRRLNEDDIDRDYRFSDKVKQELKSSSKVWLDYCESLMKKGFEEQGLLVKTCRQ